MGLENFPIFLETCQQEEELQVNDFVIYDSASFIALVYMQFYKLPDLSQTDTRKWEYTYRRLHDLTRERFARFQHIVLVPSGRFSPGPDPTRYNAEDCGRLTDYIRAFLIANGAQFAELDRTPRGRAPVITSAC